MKMHALFLLLLFLAFESSSSAVTKLSPSKTPPPRAQNVSQSFVGFGIEAKSFPAYAGMSAFEVTTHQYQLNIWQGMTLIQTNSRKICSKRSQIGRARKLTSGLGGHPCEYPWLLNHLQCLTIELKGPYEVQCYPQGGFQDSRKPKPDAPPD